MSRRLLLPALALTVALAVTPTATQVRASDGSPAPIGLIKGPSFEQAKTQALAWLADTKVDADTQRRAEALWDPAADFSLLERVAETFALGDPDAKKLLTSARDPNAPAPVAAPEVLKDAKRSVFFRANLGLAYAKELSTRRIHEEALEVLRTIRPEQVVDPASYCFFKAVAAHKLQQKQEGLETVDRLLNSVPDAPERYVVVASLMKEEMSGWKDEDLGDIARRMDNIERRLDLARGGPKTQEMERDVIARLDKMIEDLEKQC